MNVLDENVSDDQRQLLRDWGISVRQIGLDLGHKGLSDDAIIPLLRDLPRPTFFTRDGGFYRRSLTHQSYCVAHLEVRRSEVAAFVRRFLRHPDFSTFARRRATAIRVSHTGLHALRLRAEIEEVFSW